MGQILRLFVAIELPEAIHDLVGKAIKALQQTTPHDAIRWVPLENLHLTLKFLGDVPVADVERIRVHLEQAVSRFTAFDIEIAESGCFPDTKKPRVVWLGLQNPAGELLRLRDAVEAHLALLGYPTENRPFKAHLTLGRVKQNVSNKVLVQIGQGVKAASTNSLTIWHCDGVSLMQSDLTTDGAIYTRLSYLALKS